MKTLVWAHRGASGYAPENTLEAFEKAVTMKADGVELDVQLTADGKVVVAHDETIDRVSSGSGRILDYTLAQLKELRFNRTHPEYADAKIPTLREVYELLAPTGLTVNVELKTGVYRYPGIEQACIRIAEDAGMQDRVIYSSFRHESVMRLREFLPTARIGFLYADGWLEPVEYCRRWKADALHPDENTVDRELAQRCLQEEIELNIWTVNREESMRRLADWGAHALITNYPDIARRVVDNKEQDRNGGQDVSKGF